MGTPIRRGAANVRGRVDVDVIGREEWAALLEGFDDATIMQRWEFADVVCPDQVSSRLIVHRDARPLAAALVRMKLLRGLRRGIAHVSWGPLWRRKDAPHDPANLALVLRALGDEYAGRRKLLLRVAPHVSAAELDGSPSVLEAAGFKRNASIREYRTSYVDVSREPAEIRKQLRRGWRRSLDAARSGGLELLEGTDPALFREVVPLFSALCELKGFRPYLAIDRWARLQAVLPPQLRPMVFLAAHQGRPVAGLVVCADGATGFPIVFGCDSDGRRLLASYLLHWRAIEWLHGLGRRFYDLGGIAPDENPGTYYFKDGLRGQEVSFVGTYECCRSASSRLVVQVADWVRAG